MTLPSLDKHAHQSSLTKTTRSQFSSIRQAVTNEQRQFLGVLVREFIEEAQGTAMDRLSDLPSYERLIRGAYATAFVCRDANLEAAARAMRKVFASPSAFTNMSFRELRLYVHWLMRAERWNDMGQPNGGGHIHAALVAGHLRQLAGRLDSNDELG